MLANMGAIIKSLVSILSILSFCILVNCEQSDSNKQFKDFTSISQTIDEWLFSEDLFPGHSIPQNIALKDAIKMFTKLVDDLDLLSEAYSKFQVQYDKEFETDVSKYDASRHHFKDNLHFIFQHNLNHDVGKHSFQVGVNRFADMSTDEMTHFLGASKVPVQNFNSSSGPHDGHGQHAPPPHQGANNAAPPTSLGGAITLFPHSFDLSDLNLITKVKNQKKCGSCVHFSHGGLMEALYAAQNDGEHINVSEQMMLDCAIPEHGYVNNAACNGNIMEDSGQFLIDHGVTTEELYKYVAKQQNCTKEGKFVIAQLKDYYQLEPTVEAFKSTLFNEHKPISAAFLVYRPFMFYRTGIYDYCTPPYSYIGGHAVLIVGYGHFFESGFWRVKNSWGEKWGEKGYFNYIAGPNSKFCEFEQWGFTGTLA